MSRRSSRVDVASGAVASSAGRGRWMVIAAALCLAAAGLWWWRAAGEAQPAADARRDATAPTAELVVARRAPLPLPALLRESLQSMTAVACGVVVDAETGVPVEGAAVTAATGSVETLGRRSAGAAYPVAVTDAEGMWTVEGLPRGAAVAISVTATDHLPAEGRVRTASSCDQRVQVAIVAGGVSLSGTVFDALGGPVDGARVEIKRIGADAGAAFGRAPLSAMTDADGRYAVSVAPGTQSVLASADGYASARGRVEVTRRAMTRDLFLLPAGSIEGQVVDASTGSPVAGAQVYQGGVDDAHMVGAGVAAISDTEGRFIIEGVAPGTHALRAAARDRGTTSPVEVRLALGEAAASVELPISAQPYVSGRVLDSAGAPVAGVSVMFNGKGGLGVSELTGEDGAYVVGPLSPGSYMAMIADAATLSTEMGVGNLSLGTTGVTGFDLTIARRTDVRGVVRGGGPTTRVRLDVDPMVTGIAGFVKALGNAMLSTTCDDDGVFTLPGALPGTFTLVAVDDGLGRAEQRLTVHADGHDAVDLELAGPVSLDLGITDVEGRPVEGATVTLVARDSTPQIRGGALHRGISLTTDVRGRAVSRSLEPGIFDAEVELDGVRLVVQGSAEVELTEGAQRQDLQVEATLGDLEVLVVDSSGSPREGALVRATGGGGGVSGMTDDDGRVVLAAAGAVGDVRRLKVEDPADGATISVKGTVGETVEITLPIGRTLEVEVAGFGRGTVTLSGGGRTFRRSFDAGRASVEFGGVSDGTYTLRIIGESGFARSTVTLPDTEHTALPLQRWALVSGRLVDQEGGGVRDAGIIAEGTDGTSPDTPMLVTLSGGGTRTEGDGGFEELRCFPGSTTLTFYAPNGRVRTVRVELDEGERHDLGALSPSEQM